jgi:hypothetical protein
MLECPLSLPCLQTLPNTHEGSNGDSGTSLPKAKSLIFPLDAQDNANSGP